MAADVDVESLERTEAAAMPDGDVERLEQIWHHDFIVNHPLNVVVTKSEVLDWVRSGQVAFGRIERTVEAVRVVGDTAISMGQEVLEPASGTAGAGRTVTTRYTHVWIRTGDRWQLAARHAPAMVETAT
jgi:ketosteroid isomerase-like protein